MQINFLITKTALTWILIAAGVGLILIIGSILICCIVKQKKNTVFVMQNSVKIRKLIKLNDYYQFYKIDGTLTERESCKSKREFDKYDLNNIFDRFNSNPKYYETLFCKVDYNKDKYKEYLQLYKTIINLDNKINFNRVKIKKERFEKIEKKKLQQLIQTPALEFNYLLNITYTSPQGRNHYKKHYSWNYKKTRDQFFAAREKWQSQQTRGYQIKLERNKMSDSLRYDILKRDGFRCKICGRTAEEGYKLEVDHIIPVAQGGKTVESNLQTLCERCNRGKRDKL